MAFGREVHDAVGLMLIEKRAQIRRVADVDLGERVARVSGRLRDGGEVRRVGELVDIDDVRAGAVEQVPDDGRADEAGASGHEDGLAFEGHVDMPTPAASSRCRERVVD